MQKRRGFHGEVINCRPRKTKKKYNRRFIKSRIEKNKIDIIVKKFENDDRTQTIVVKRVSVGAKIFELLFDGIFTIIKILFWVGVCVLITIGLNTLLNNQLREQIFNMFKNIMGG